MVVAQFVFYFEDGGIATLKRVPVVVIGSEPTEVGGNRLACLLVYTWSLFLRTGIPLVPTEDLPVMS